MRNFAFFAALAAASFSAASAGASVIYSNDFNTDTSGFVLAGGAASETAPNGQTYIGGLGLGATASLTLDTTGLSSITLLFDLYTILSPDGNTAATGPDFFRVDVGGGPTLLNETFSNFLFQQQSYGPNASDAGGTGSDGALYGQLGYQWNPAAYDPDGKDRTYHLAYTFAPTGASTTLVFTGLTDQALDDERFGLDNVVVQGSVPEPGTWALMILGFGGVGAALRRRTRLAVA
jgi:hypothetical protein